MRRRSSLEAIHLTAVAALALGGCTVQSNEGMGSAADVSQMSEEELVEYARGVHDRVITLDTHVDIPFTFASVEVDPGRRSDRYQVDLPKMEEGGLDAAFFIVYVGQRPRTPENYEGAKQQAIRKFEGIHRMAEEMYPNWIEIAYHPEDVARIHSQGKLVAMIGIENGFVIGKDLSLLADYQARGARYMTLAHNGNNDIADSHQPREGEGFEHGGISDFGAEVIAEMNRVGIMVDVSHISKDAMMEAVQLSRAPVIASHSSTRSVREHTRNLDDEQLRAMAENGGVAQMVALSSYVGETPPEQREAIQELNREFGINSSRDVQAFSEERRAEYEARRAEIEARWPSPDVADFVDHIDHAVEVAGIDHVGIASDFDGGGGIVGWDDASETFNLTLEMVRRGYTEEEIRKIWGGNLLRVWSEVERIASELQEGATE